MITWERTCRAGQDTGRPDRVIHVKAMPCIHETHWQRLLVPAWVVEYEMDGEQYRAFVCGRTGCVGGEKHMDTAKHRHVSVVRGALKGAAVSISFMLYYCLGLMFEHPEVYRCTPPFEDLAVYMGFPVVSAAIGAFIGFAHARTAATTVQAHAEKEKGRLAELDRLRAYKASLSTAPFLPPGNACTAAVMARRSLYADGEPLDQGAAAHKEPHHDAQEFAAHSENELEEQQSVERLAKEWEKRMGETASEAAVDLELELERERKSARNGRSGSGW